MMRRLAFIVGVAALALLPVSATQGADMMMAASNALKIASTHAGFAASYSTAAEVELHLHHVVNCLEGDNGKNYNKDAGNVCTGQGNGILVDLKSSGMAGAHASPYAEIADQVALWGIQQTMNKDIGRAHAAAAVAKDALDLAIGNFK
jgi:hypothetical protein